MAEKIEVFMTKKITCKNPRRQHGRAYFPVHQILRPEECKTCSLDGKSKKTRAPVSPSITAAAVYLTWISYGITVFCHIQELLNLR